MRRFALLVALAGMVAAPLQAEGTADIYSKDGVSGPSFARSTQCAAIYTAVAVLLGRSDPAYQDTVNKGTGWYVWAGDIAEGADLAAELEKRKKAFESRTKNMNNDDYNAELAKELKYCQTVKAMFDGMEPFTTTFNNAPGPDAVAASSGGSSKPDLNLAIDCAAVNDLAVGVLGKDNPDSASYIASYEGWSGYVRNIFSGDESDLQDLYNERSGSLGKGYQDMENEEADSGYNQLSADVDTCLGLEPSISEFF